MALIALSELKKFIHMGEIHDDALLQSIIDGTIGKVEQRTGQILSSTVTTEYHDGDRTNTILLDNGCITLVTHVKIDGVTVYTPAAPNDYEWYAVGEIVRKVGYFSRGFKNIEVNYTHGFSALIVVATNLPFNVGFNIYRDRPSKVCNGYYSGLAAVVLNSVANGGGGTAYTEGTDYTTMELTGEVVALEAGIPSGTVVYVSSGTYTKYSNLPPDLRIALLKIMSNTYHGSLVVMEVEGEAKIYSQKEIDAVIGKYVRLPI